MEETMQEANLSSATLTQSETLIDRQEQPGRFLRMSRALIAGVLLSIAPAIRNAEAGEPTGGVGNRTFVDTGSLVIAGGGVLPQEIRERFVELGGGKNAKVVIITTASDDADDPNKEPTFYWEGLKDGVTSVDIFHTRDRAKADCNEATSKLDNATAIWFSGGKQGSLAFAYLKTRTLEKVGNVFRRGGVIGGTSAGAAVMTKTMIEDQTKTENGMSELIIGEGFDFFQGAVVDQHFKKRNRGWRLDRVLQQQPTLVGFGIDEGTALIVRAGKMHVIGDSTVSVRTKMGEIKVLNHGATEELADFGMPAIVDPMVTAGR